MSKILKGYISQKQKGVVKLIGRIKLANLLDLNEDTFKETIKKIERTALFKKLAYPDNFQSKKDKFFAVPQNGCCKNIRYKR